MQAPKAGRIVRQIGSAVISALRTPPKFKLSAGESILLEEPAGAVSSISGAPGYDPGYGILTDRRFIIIAEAPSGAIGIANSVISAVSAAYRDWLRERVIIYQIPLSDLLALEPRERWNSQTTTIHSRTLPPKEVSCSSPMREALLRATLAADPKAQLRSEAGRQVVVRQLV